MTANGSLVAPATAASTSRVDWVDYAKGICIILVVMMHSVLGTELAAGHTGFMHVVVEFAKPFRMPDFFLLSGLFLAVVINRDWRTYLDRKVMHFAYFYVLWVTIQFAFKAQNLTDGQGFGHLLYLYAMAYIEPFGTLWFIYMLPVFFMVTRLSRALPTPLVFAIAALLEMAHIVTGWTAIDEFAARYVYFYAGYLFATQIFAMSDYARARPALSLAGIAIWALVNAGLVHAGISEWPVVSLALGFAGAFAIVVAGTLLARMQWLTFFRYCGEHSIVIYLAFFLPMAVLRMSLLKFSGLDVGTVSLIVTVGSVIGALLIWRLALKTRATFLFERPALFWLTPKRASKPELQAAE